MRCKILVSLLLLLPFFAISQNGSKWNLSINKTKLLSSSVDSVASVRLSKNSHGMLKLSFAKKDKSYKRTVLLMNKQRQTFLQNEMKAGSQKTTFFMAELLSKSKGQPFTIYIADIPSDPAKAMLVRVAPVAICDAEWK